MSRLGVILLAVFLLAVGHIIIEIIFSIIPKVKEEEKKRREAGCHCPLHFGLFLESSPECPVCGEHFVYAYLF